MCNILPILHVAFLTGITHEALAQSFRNTDFITWEDVTFVAVHK